MVSAWASSNNICLGQVKAEAKSNEITAIPRLLDMLLLKGCIVTIDAMGARTEIAKKIRKKEADYLLCLKSNHETMHEEVREAFDNLETKSYETTEKGDGRIEKRRYELTTDIDWFADKDRWRDLKSFVKVTSERVIGEERSGETRYFISSLTDVNQAALGIRKHWGVENQLHWVLDLNFREDESRMREGFSAQNMAVFRRLALNLVKQDKDSKDSLRLRRKKAGWSNNYMEKLLFFTKT